VITAKCTAAKREGDELARAMRVPSLIACAGVVVATATLMACTWIGGVSVSAPNLLSVGEPSSAAMRPTVPVTEEIAGGAALARVLFAEHATLPVVDELAELTRIEVQSQTSDVASIVVALQRGHLDEARTTADRLIQQRAGEPVSHQMMGVVLLAAGDHNAARSSFERAIAIDAAFVQPIASLAQLDMREGKTDVALARFEAAMSRRSVSPAFLKGYEALLRDAGLDRSGKAAFSRPITRAAR
jgi:tetratricopeptide (TPR) repeat protein